MTLAPADACLAPEEIAMALVLTHATVLTVDPQDRVLDDRDIRIDGRTIAAIGPGGTLAIPGDITLDCTRGLVMPGLVNTHTHAATALFRGLADDKPREFWPEGGYSVPGQERFTMADYRGSLAAACAEFLGNGVTTIADRVAGMDQLAPVIAASGMRAVVGSTIADAGGPVDWGATERVIERYGVDPMASRISAGIAPHALDTCSDALLAECARRAERHGAKVFLHVAQSAAEVASIRRRGHSGALACLRCAGLTGPDVIAAHCIYLDEDEIDGFCADGTAICHCPASNLKIEARTLPLARYLGRTPVGLGTDWTASNNSMDMFWEMRLAALVGKMKADDPTVLDTRQMLRLATLDGAKVLGIDHLVGSVEPGKRADLVVLDLAALEMAPLHDAISNVVYSASPRSVRDVLVDGEIRVRDHRLVQDHRSWAEAS
ncbi:amidohydrolase family protein [Phreatobacter stygius]|uniref:Amidohydrolase n=1 Tax=Phreatobacter stygius TaxID=1940610 RepID=A0A4D7B8N3_9HYPH|nr:amidohydrolase [Phreatobacter stygius]QCI66790.1 amidohydrolase [Phreatobacter stygius]